MASVKDDQNQSGSPPDAGAARAAIETARRLLQGGDADGAAGALRQVSTRAEAPPPELAAAAKVMADAGSPVDAVNRYLESGRGYLDAGDIATARQQFASAYEIDGKNMDALFELGRADVADGKKHDALDKFVEVLRKSNLKHLPALYEAGCLYELDGQHNQAILAFKRVVERDKTHAAAFEHLGDLHRVRDQKPEAVANYVRAADAAQARRSFGDAKRLAELALSIEGTNAAARRALAEADRGLAGAVATPAPPAARPAAPPPAQPLPHPAISEVTPVTPPTADGSAAAPPPGGMSIGFPTDVALLEQQSQAMAQLAQVQSAVAQTYRARMALDEEIKKAQAALEALHRQQQSVDEDLSGKRDELEKIVAQREAEEAALAALGDAIARSKAELDALSSLPQFIAGVRRQCADAADAAAKTRSGLDAVGKQSSDVAGKAGEIDAAVRDLQSKLGSARQSADAIERQLAELSAQSSAAQGVAATAASTVAQAKSALAALDEQTQAVARAHGALADTSTAVERKRGEAAEALKRLEALQAQRKTQFEEVVFALTPLVGAAGAATAAAAAAATETKPRPAPPAPAPKPAASASAAAAPQSVEGLIGAGKFGDAVKRAQTDANAHSKPAEYLVAVGRKFAAAGRLEDAATLFAAARDRDQQSAHARFELGSTYVELGRTADAMPLLESVESDPEYAVLGQVAIGKCLRRQGDVGGAEARFSRALEAEGRPEAEYHQALYQLAELQEGKGDPESLGLALWSYEELQTGNPNYGDVAVRIANVKAKLADSGVRSEPARNGAVN